LGGCYRGLLLRIGGVAMTLELKSILIQAIIRYLSEETKRKNKGLVKDNLYTEQKAFDADDMFLKLAFLPDKDIEHIASKILG